MILQDYVVQHRSLTWTAIVLLWFSSLPLSLLPSFLCAPAIFLGVSFSIDATLDDVSVPSTNRDIPLSSWRNVPPTGLDTERHLGNMGTQNLSLDPKHLKSLHRAHAYRLYKVNLYPLPKILLSKEPESVIIIIVSIIIVIIIFVSIIIDIIIIISCIIHTRNM